MSLRYHPMDEWLEADGLGGFASGTVSGIRTRRYHGLLLAATSPPTGRVLLVNGVEAWIEDDAGVLPLTTQHYLPDVRHPDGVTRLIDFRPDPWPTWRYEIGPRLEIEHQLLVPRGEPTVVLRWRVLGVPPGGSLRLRARPLMSGRDMHALHRENPDFRFASEMSGPARVAWRPYRDCPAILSHANGRYENDPIWYHGFLYAEERARGFDHSEDLASPGVLTWEIERDEAVWILEAAPDIAWDAAGGRADPVRRLHRFLGFETARRDRFPTRLHRAADSYIVRRGDGASVIAGYPWFGDWGRDTFISIRGLCLATGRLDEAAAMLRQWAGEVSEGLLPNRFVERGDEPEFNSVDAALWYVVAVDEFLRKAETAGRDDLTAGRGTLERAVAEILSGYASGTRHGIGLDDDGLLAAGVPGLQLTWMDARVGDWVVTPRIGKPVEMQALWANALAVGARFDARWNDPFRRVRESFPDRFWNAGRSCLFDVVDVDHVPGTVDAAFRPNQILAVGGLPISLLDAERCRVVVNQVERRLWTPLGLRSLAPDEPGYRARYEGGPVDRDGSYHQGTAWAWLLGPFVEAWLRTRPEEPDARAVARRRFLEPLIAHLDRAGLGHISEIADGDAPHTPRGCPFQAWSVGEALRLSAAVLVERGRAEVEPPDSAPDPTRAGTRGATVPGREEDT